MFPTTEVRWFLPRVVPDRVWHWIDGQTKMPTGQPPRTDYYLRIAYGDALGIKLREGRIEVKQRQAQQRIAHFGKSAGHVEQWCKWSFSLAEAETVTAVLGDDLPAWIGVHKARKVRTFQLQNGTVVDVSGQDSLEQGCGWEVAQVRLGKTAEPWWSIGFEAFGPERSELLRIVTKYCLEMDAAPALKLDDSFSYPQWLQNVVSQGHEDKGAL